MANEFYVGYLDRAPAGVARFARSRVLSLLLLAVVVAVALTASQRAFARSTFEFGVVRPFEGWIEERPYPTLVVERPGAADGAVSRYLLTVFGKFGAEPTVAGLDGTYVQLEGSLIYRDGATMIEVAEGTLEELPGRRSRPRPVASAGENRTLEGEIVDSKCFLGVMKPGNLKPHRACATRCIAGGVPPVFLVRDAEGTATYYLLTDEAGGPVGAAVVERGLVAEPLRVTGEVLAYGDRLVLRADPGTFVRL